jgi:hypothetical protein
MRAKNFRVVAGFLAVLGTGLIAAPVETAARGGGFGGGGRGGFGGGGFGGSHGMSFRGGFRAPIVRPAIARPTRAAVPARIHNTVPFARFQHRIGPRRIWVGAPWYGDYGAYWYGDYGDSTDVVPDVQTPSATGPSPDSNMTPRRLGCSAQTYRVPSEAGGETSVKVVRC